MSLLLLLPSSGGRRQALVCIALFALACSSRENQPGPGAGGASDKGELTGEPCERDDDCQDDAFCNGIESCDDGECRRGVAPSCDDGIACTQDRCSHAENGCVFEAPDADGDGHLDGACVATSGERLGDDCDDEDPTRFPGNSEICTTDAPTHDEDCDPTTFGERDDDLDGEVSSACCNEDASGEVTCGTDCDDGDYRRNSTYPEICDEIDNDCDGEVDVNTKEVPWYPDVDGDNFGDSSGKPILSCAPLNGRSLRDTDCDDSFSGVHPAAFESCDYADNNCDGQIDEGGVCACSPEGDARACACSGNQAGVQRCQGGQWARCDCTECVTGTVDCLGELLPRECIAGRWVVKPACKGLRPICLGGECACADGTMNCEDVVDVVPPALLTTAPLAGASQFKVNGVLAAVFTESIATASAQLGGIRLVDGFDQPVDGHIAVGGPTVTFTPTVPLAPGMRFTFIIEGTITDIAGNVLPASHAVTFYTEVTALTTPLTPPVNVAYSAPVLAMSPSGTAKMLVSKTTGVGSPVVEGTFVMSWNGSAWTEEVKLYDSFEAGWLDVAQNGDALAIETRVSDYYLVDRLMGTWRAPTLIEGYAEALGVVTANDGTSAAFFRDAVTLHVQRRDALGNFLGTSQMHSGTVSGAELAINASGCGAIAYLDDGAAQLWRSSSDLTAWKLTTVASPIDGDISYIDVAMDAACVAHVTYNQDVDDGTMPTILRKQGFYAQVNSSGAISHPGELINGQPLPRAEWASRVGVADDGSVVISTMLDGGSVARIRSPQGTFGPEHRVNIEPVNLIGAPILRVAGSGHALVVWQQRLEKNFPLDVWAAKYTPGTGWKSGLLISYASGASYVQAEINDAGNALVVFESAGIKTVSF